jgi:hypothetical protein
MKISSKFMSYFKLDQSYSLLNCRNVSVLLEFFRALDVRDIMALDGKEDEGPVQSQLQVGEC